MHNSSGLAWSSGKFALVAIAAPLGAGRSWDCSLGGGVSSAREYCEIRTARRGAPLDLIGWAHVQILLSSIPSGTPSCPSGTPSQVSIYFRARPEKTMP